jgi:NCAIR mutase (PurE)-related protein
VIFCQGKRPEQTRQIAREILKRSGILLATRADRKTFLAIRSVARTAEYNEIARTVTVRSARCAQRKKNIDKHGFVLVVSAGTSDMPVAEEARVTAEIMGREVRTLYDVGVAGIHRVLAHQDLLRKASVIVAVAGMEGALPSVVAGLVHGPVIAVPTSVGYGASFGGVAALLTMLNSCAAGIGVVNIDNGFGAGYLAALICGGAPGDSHGC